MSSNRRYLEQVFSSSSFPSGKTTLLNHLCHVQQETGYLSHTKTTSVYEMTPTIHVIDFPGVTSLERYREATQLYGHVTDLLILVTPYTGDISTSDTHVFNGMKNNPHTKIIWCINKSKDVLSGVIQQLTESGERNPHTFIKTDLARKLQEHFKNEEKDFKIDPDDIFFTDWKDYDKKKWKTLGIVGPDAIKSEINRYYKSKSGGHDLID